MKNLNELNFLNELEEFINNEDAKDLNIIQSENDNAFCITNLDQADYILRKYNETLKEIEEIEEIARKKKNEYFDKVDRFVEQSTKGALSSLAYLEGLLRTFTEDYLKDKNKKSIKLVEGTLSLRSQKPKYVYNEDILMKWLNENNKELIKEKVTYSPDKEKIKSAVEIVGNNAVLNGEIIQGIEIEHLKDSFKIKPSL